MVNVKDNACYTGESFSGFAYFHKVQRSDYRHAKQRPVTNPREMNFALQ